MSVGMTSIRVAVADDAAAVAASVVVLLLIVIVIAVVVDGGGGELFGDTRGFRRFEYGRRTPRGFAKSYAR
jgi:hypothetical protein